jgi:hypothetical protein
MLSIFDSDLHKTKSAADSRKAEPRSQANSTGHSSNARVISSVCTQVADSPALLARHPSHTTAIKRRIRNEQTRIFGSHSCDVRNGFRSVRPAVVCLAQQAAIVRLYSSDSVRGVLMCPSGTRRASGKESPELCGAPASTPPQFPGWGANCVLFFFIGTFFLCSDRSKLWFSRALQNRGSTLQYGWYFTAAKWHDRPRPDVVDSPLK